ncbi:MAG: T9SS type A sorting domain-containing protein [Gloeobacteraceae cyanobacterium ES-bin-316]|nr:T9SS type A sorting domain-containing protein [Ferruginibacter sp.]
MKKFYLFLMAATLVFSSSTIKAQCNGNKGPNLLGAKGSFSTPFITVNNAASACIQNGANSYTPIGNVGNALAGCTSLGTAIPCSDYTYTAANNGLTPEGTYSILKTIGDASGSNCIKPQWKGADHTGDAGYFMAVNGASTSTTSPVFYKIKTIAVCIGATYEFSSWVINLLPAGHPAANPGSEPNISVRVNGVVIGNSGPLAYTATPTWVKISGSFVATTNTVDLEVINATAVAVGNDLGLDDISINVCQSQITVDGPATVCEGTEDAVDYTVTDAFQTNTWYQFQLSTDGGTVFTNLGGAAQAVFMGNSYTVTLSLGTVFSTMNGYKYRLVVSTSQAGLANPDCIYFNDYTLVAPACGPLPVTLVAFNGKYNNGVSSLDWQTTQEINGDRFDIMRSTNGKDFTVVGKVKSAGNSSISRSYQFQDNISGAGYVYYRLRQVDVDGKNATSAIVRLNMGSKAATFELYPNPFVSNFTASFSATKVANATLQIRNINGQVLYTKTIAVTKGFNAVQMNNLPVLSRGLYHVTVQNEELNFQGKMQKL